MGKQKSSSKPRKHQAPSKQRTVARPARKPAAKTAKKPVKKAAAKPVKKAAPPPRKSQPVRNKTVVNKPTHSSSSAKTAKSAAKPPATPPAKAGAKPATAPASAEAAADASSRMSPDALRRQLVAKAKSRAKPQRAVAFTLDDVRGELAKVRPTRKEKDKADEGRVAAPARAASQGKRIVNEIKPTHRHFGAASLADILGYNPVKEDMPEDEESTIDKKFLRYYRLLVQLRDHVKSGLALHAEDTLKRSSRDDAGDLSGYGQHMADAGTDAFDRDFALSLVSNEQEALFEIEEAIKRIKNGTYGVCELTGKPINKERLLAVPFARYSVESQAEVEKTRRRTSQRGGLFGDVAGEDGAKIADDDGE